MKNILSRIIENIRERKYQKVNEFNKTLEFDAIKYFDITEINGSRFLRISIRSVNGISLEDILIPIEQLKDISVTLEYLRKKFIESHKKLKYE